MNGAMTLIITTLSITALDIFMLSVGNKPTMLSVVTPYKQLLFKLAMPNYIFVT
jgi:hypothetical protein